MTYIDFAEREARLINTLNKYDVDVFLLADKLKFPGDNAETKCTIEYVDGNTKIGVLRIFKVH